MSRGAQRGQAAVESIGIAVLVALLLAAVSTWLVREVRPPERPPALIEAAAAPLTRDPAPFDYRYPLPPPAFEMPRGRGDEPIGRVLRAAAACASHEFRGAIGIPAAGPRSPARASASPSVRG